MIHKVYTTDNFDKRFEKLSQEEKRRIENIFLQIKENPYVGDQLRIKSLREKRLVEKRIYYLIFDDLNAVLFVAIGDKKTQQETIDLIIGDLNWYRNYMISLLKRSRDSSDSSFFNIF